MKFFATLVLITSLGWLALRACRNSWESGYQAAQAEILAEATQNAKKPAAKSIEKSIAQKGIQPHWVDQSVTARTPTSDLGTLQLQDNSKSEAFFSVHPANKHLTWCRPSTLSLPSETGGLCKYLGACFYCDANGYELIQTDQAGTIPKCADPSNPAVTVHARQENASCCPLGKPGEPNECPDLRDCFEESANQCANSI